MMFIIGERNRIWEDRESIGHDLPNRAKSFDEQARLKDIWAWIIDDGTGEPRGNIEIIPEGK